MNISIRHWLAERYIEISTLKDLTPGQLAGIAFRIIEDMEVKSFISFDICTLTEVLELPLGAVWQEITIIALLTEEILRSLSQKKPLKRNEGTWLVFQVAYLQALQQVLHQEAELQKPWLDRAMVWLHHTKEPIASPSLLPKPLQNAQLQALLKTLTPGKLTDTQAEQALSLVADSLLVQQMNNATVAWLVANGAEETEAKLLTQRLSHGLPGHLLKVIAENAAPLAQLQKFVGLGNSLPPNSTVDDKIDLYREQYRASLLQNLSQPLLMESFALKDIYVPLSGLPRENNSLEPAKQTTSAVDLRTWAQQQLDDLATIALIESEAGYGKSSFCEIWAAKVARELYPTWIPIIIRLRDIKYGNTLESTLNSGFLLRHQTNLATWLQQNHPRCLLLLDGLDELPPSDLGKRSKVLFIEDLLRLQSQGRHKIVLTSRTSTLQEIIPELPLLSKRIAIQPLDLEGLRQWFQNWTAIQSLLIAQNYFTFLKQAGLFASNSKMPALSAFVRQPLMLYLLGILHRDGLLDEEVLKLTANSQDLASATLLWEIHQRLSHWLLGYPLTGATKTTLLRSGAAHIHRTPAAIANLLARRHPQDLLAQIQAIALQILHSDRHQVYLEEKFSPHSLPAFYFQNSRFILTDAQGSIATPQGTQLLTEFTHSIIGEYLCAAAIVTQLQVLTHYQQQADVTLAFIINSPSSVAQHLYNLLGYGVLSQTIEAQAIAGLKRLPKWKFSFTVLCQRLESFWRDYCQGRWFNEGIAHQALTHFHALHNPINVEQVNAAVGMNVFLLLSACYRQENIPFSPNGNPHHSAEFYPQNLYQLIAKTAVLSTNAFSKRIASQALAGINLSKAYLPQVTLAASNLEHTNLSDAVLIGANLAGANLTGANLAGANLTGANLAGANLTDANLTIANLAGANLTDVNLTGTNLTHTCLFGTILSEDNRETATLNGAIFSLQQFQTLKQILSQHSLGHITQATANPNHDLKNLPDMVLIESLEGEPILPADIYHDVSEDETILTINSRDHHHHY